MAVTGLKMFGVAALGEREDGPLAPQTASVVVRELGAVVRAAPYARVEMSDIELDDYQQVVESVFERHTIIPAPFGTVFRSRDQLTRWIELHYAALSDGMHLIDGRCEMRVHLRPTVAKGAGAKEINLALIAADTFRVLRTSATAGVHLRNSEVHTTHGIAFLVDRSHWQDFSALVLTQSKQTEGVDFERSGPWPPYDFVHMDLG
ncbi:MAG: GvpL/GvpF family gas vesicle protein [Anaerolineae bacterium]|nr:GvpL/GvpF family gas vesicle protein [Gemmatimonadaceae bacterium]